MKDFQIKKPQALRFNTGKSMWRYFCPDAFKVMLDVLDYGAFKYTTFKVTETEESNFILGQEVTGNDILQGNYDKTITQNWEVIRSGSDQWKDGLSIKECIESALRHLFAFKEGEDIDPESNLPHIGHLLCNCMFISYMIIFKPTYDDRCKVLF